MIELKQILCSHAARYPAMEPTDAVKLIFQNEFGGGHLIARPEDALSYLRREYEAVAKDPAAPLYENIGNGVVRVNLAALPQEKLEDLGRAFIRSAAAHKGDMARFREKLRLLRALCVEGKFSFSLEALDAYLSQYEQAGFPMVSHSDAYRTAYHPAYRIIKENEICINAMPQRD